MQKKRVLYVSQEIVPYTGETTMGDVASLLPQKTQESGKDIRMFLPRFGTINERCKYSKREAKIAQIERKRSRLNN